MKTITTFFFLCYCFYSIAQNNEFTIQGKVTNAKGNPIADVYIINPRTLEKDITQPNGTFSVIVNPKDSLIFSHISYFRKSEQVYTLQQNPVVTLETENVQIKEVTVRSNQISDYDRALNNLSFIKNYKPIKYNKINPEIDPLQSLMTEHNRLMRSEAGSINLLPILGIAVNLVDKTVKKRKRRKLYSTDYFSTRKQKELEEETE